MNYSVFIYLCIPLSLLFVITLNLPNLVFASSPQFPEQEMKDNRRDWKNMNTMKNAIFEFGVPDITSANYFSNGTVLNATLWLAKPFSEHPRQFNEVDYGMFIDSDFNR